jgi:hypothetical protein
MMTGGGGGEGRSDMATDRTDTFEAGGREPSTPE